MHDLILFQKKFNISFVSSLERNITRSKKYTSDPTIHHYIDYIKIIATHGKRIRPYVISMVCTDHNKKASTELLLGIEYLHLFALIHDDIIDQASLRHGIPTTQMYLQTTYGLSRDQALHQTILIGDLVFNWASEHVYKASKDNYSLGLAYFTLVSELAVGQMLDTDMPRRSHIDDTLVSEKNKIKSGRYTFARPMVLGALSSKLDTKACKAYVALGEILGELFQLGDDFIDVTTRTVDLGKNIFQDFNEKQHTPLSWYMTTQAPHKYRNIFMKRMWGADLTEADFPWVQEVIYASGLCSYIEERKLNLYTKAQKQIMRLPIDIKRKKKWYDICEFIYNRTK